MSLKRLREDAYLLDALTRFYQREEHQSLVDQTKLVIAARVEAARIEGKASEVNDLMSLKNWLESCQSPI
jgi:hypothetical protein